MDIAERRGAQRGRIAAAKAQHTHRCTVDYLTMATVSIDERDEMARALAALRLRLDNYWRVEASPLDTTSREQYRNRSS